jgi:hypothetical protein
MAHAPLRLDAEARDEPPGEKLPSPSWEKGLFERFSARLPCASTPQTSLLRLFSPMNAGLEPRPPAAQKAFCRRR